MPKVGTGWAQGGGVATKFAFADAGPSVRLSSDNSPIIIAYCEKFKMRVLVLSVSGCLEKFRITPSVLDYKEIGLRRNKTIGSKCPGIAKPGVQTNSI